MQATSIALLLLFSASAAPAQGTSAKTPDWWPLLPKPGVNNVWYARNPASDTVVIFIHGILSESRTAWLSGDPQQPSRCMYWPNLVCRDPNLRKPSVYLAGFYTALDSGDYDMKKAGLEIADALKRDRVLEGRSRVVLIGHSTGGIMARYLLVHHGELFQSKKVGLLLLASPSLGSKLADILDPPARFYKQKMAQQLQWQSEFLRQLDDDFRALLHEKKSLNIVGREVVETQFVVHHKLIPSSTLVVEELSGSRYFGPARAIGGADHFSIVKPDTFAHPSHQVLVGFYHEHFGDGIGRPKRSEAELNAAILDLTAKLDLNPKDAYSYWQRGRAYAERNQKENALADFNKALEIYPDDLNTLFERAQIYAGRNQWDQAIADLNTMQRISPDSPVVYWFRGYYYQQASSTRPTAAEKSAFQQSAIDDFTTALRLQPKVWVFHDLRAASFRALGRVADAEKDAAEAARLRK
jgi:tetratricopeptide (TPR) repeat protein